MLSKSKLVEIILWNNIQASSIVDMEIIALKLIMKRNSNLKEKNEREKKL